MARRAEIDLRAEFARAELGDKRLSSRLDRLVSALEDTPDRSFPSAMGSDAELEAAYRFFQNARVTLDALITPHIAATIERIRDQGAVAVAHDTTEFRFEGMKRRDGLGQLGMQRADSRPEIVAEEASSSSSVTLIAALDDPTLFT